CVLPDAADKCTSQVSSSSNVPSPETLTTMVAVLCPGSNVTTPDGKPPLVPSASWPVRNSAASAVPPCTFHCTVVVTDRSPVRVTVKVRCTEPVSPSSPVTTLPVRATCTSWL